MCAEVRDDLQRKLQKEHHREADMSGLILVVTIFAAMAVGIISGFAVLNVFFQVMGRSRQTPAPLAKAVPAV
jgi:hypothetical protein